MDLSVPGLPLYDRGFTGREIEQTRLLLSTFCDGSGATNRYVTHTVPDYRDFERVTAAVCHGDTGEDKNIFDVHVPVPNALPYGVSCKMAGIGSPRDPDTAFIELSNSSKKFTDAFRRNDVDWRIEPEVAGPITVDLVTSWHDEVRDSVDVDASSFLLLTHNNNWSQYKLSQFPLDLKLADPETEIRWEVRRHRVTAKANALVGTFIDGDIEHRMWELYPESGGQLKYRPMWDWAYWQSEWFELELPPIRELEEQAQLYFPHLWGRVI